MAETRRYRGYVSMGLCRAETTFRMCTYRTFARNELKTSSFLERRKRSRSAEPTLTALRLKKSRLRKAALVIASKHGMRARFCTATFRFKEELKGKSHFHERLKYLFKKLKRAGFGLAYSGMMERHKSGAWHFHFLAYRVGGRLWRGVPAWDYEEMQRVAVSLDGNIDFQRLRSSKDCGRRISEYMAKLDVVVAAAYMAKRQGGEDYCYTFTSKGCDLPKRKYYFRDDAYMAEDFLELFNFVKMEGGGFPYYLSRDEKFSRDFYDSA